MTSTAIATAEQPETPALPPLTFDDWSNGLDEQEVTFVLEYVKDLRVERAARKAGYARSMAITKAYGWVSKGSCTKPHVRRAADFWLEQRRSETIITADQVLRRIKAIAVADIRDVAEFRSQRIEDEEPGDDGIVRVATSNTVEIKASDELDDEAAAAIKSIKQDKDGNVHIEMHNPGPALQMLAKHLGLLDDTVRLTGPGGGPIQMVTANVSIEEAAERWRAMLENDP